MLSRQLEIAATDGSGGGVVGIEETTGVPAPLAFATAGGLFLTELIVWLCCSSTSSASLSWAGLGAYAAIYLIAALAIYAIVLRVLYRLFGDQIERPFREIMYQTWSPALWLPLLALLEHQRSPWVTAVPLIIAVQITLFLRNVTRKREQIVDLEPMEEPLLFSQRDGTDSPRRIRPALMTSIAFECGISLLLIRQHLFAGMWFASAVVYPVWKLSGKAPDESESANGVRKLVTLIARMLLPLALTASALVPFLKDAAVAGPFTRLLQFAFNEPRPVLASTPQHRGNFFSGLILLTPSKPIKELVTLPAEASKTSFGHALTKPLEITFDGVYWYFDPFDERPRPDAPTVHGDPVRNTIRSTYNQAVRMMAHQILDQTIPVTCCRALRVEISNGEGSLGPINLEMVLSNTAIQKGARTLSLGNMFVPLSTERHDWLAQHPIDETLSFPFPKTARLNEFNEITVAIKPFNDRTERGAHIAIKKFTLVP
jgi:hypothetical protein